MADDTEKGDLVKRIQMRHTNQSIEKAQTGAKRQQRDYSQAIIEFLRDNGQIVCISDDLPFTKLLRELIIDTLKMPASCLSVSSRADMLGRTARSAAANGKSLVVIIDQVLNGRDLTFVVKVIKNAFPELKILMLVAETDKNHFVLLHESGVDSFLVKPLDLSTLLEKLALTIKPNEQIDRTLDMARTLLEKGEHLHALQICTKALEQPVNSTSTFLLMGDIFKAMREWNKAADSYQRASGASSVYLEPLKKLAELYSEKGDMARQLEYLEKMDELSPLNLERKIQIGELALKLKKPDKAKKIFDQVMKLSNRQAKESISTVAYRVADIYVETDPDTAATFIQKGLDARKEFWGHEDIATFNRLGLLLRRSGKWREATEAYQKALTVAPNDENLHYNLAMAYLEGKEVESARASALKAMGINPELPKKSSRIAANLGAVFISSNDLVHARPLLRTALELDPANAQALELQAKAEEMAK